jgi:hypothetical protein
MRYLVVRPPEGRIALTAFGKSLKNRMPASSLRYGYQA